jgi:hypothetical protein
MTDRPRGDWPHPPSRDDVPGVGRSNPRLEKFPNPVHRRAALSARVERREADMRQLWPHFEVDIAARSLHFVPAFRAGVIAQDFVASHMNERRRHVGAGFGSKGSRNIGVFLWLAKEQIYMLGVNDPKYVRR